MTLKRALGLGALALTAYIGLPYVLVQVLGLGLVRQGSWGKYALALTFDDGPDPATTPHVLEALSAAEAKATFFVLTEQAKAYPDLLQRMAEQGHQVELHATRHTHAWVTPPWAAYAEPLRGKAALARLGVTVRYHRPPHGAYTLATMLGQRAAGLMGAHWDIETHDWHPQYTPQRVTRRVLRYAHPGAVVVLHDAGPGAANTVAALPGLLGELRRRGYALVRLDELEGAVPLALRGQQGLARRLSMLTDRAFDAVGHARPIMGRADAFFRLGLIAMPLTVTLNTGKVLLKGQQVLDIHVNSPQMVDYGIKKGLRRARAWDLPLLAEEFQRRPEWQKAAYITTIGGFSSILSLLGFETHEVPPAMQRRLGLWGQILKWAYGSSAQPPEIKLSVIAAQDFVARYAGKGQPQSDGGPLEWDGMMDDEVLA